MDFKKNAGRIVAAVALAAAFMGGIALAPVLVAPAAAQLLSGAGASTSDNRGPGADLFSAAAQYIGITVDQLRTEMGTDKSLADVAASHGKTRDGLVQALTTAAQQNLAQRITDLVDHKGFGPKGFGPGGLGMGGPGGHGHVFAMRGEPLEAASKYLGISTSDLRTKLQGGQTLAQIATAAGKTRDGLIQALVQDETAKIDQAVKDGKLTADQATKIKSGIQDRVTNLVDGKMPGPGFFHPGFGPGGPRGPQAPGTQSR